MLAPTKSVCVNNFHIDWFTSLLKIPFHHSKETLSSIFPHKKKLEIKNAESIATVRKYRTNRTSSLFLLGGHTEDFRLLLRLRRLILFDLWVSSTNNFVVSFLFESSLVINSVNVNQG